MRLHRGRHWNGLLAHRLTRRYALVLVGLVVGVVLVSGGIQGYAAYVDGRASAERLQQEQAVRAAERVTGFLQPMLTQIAQTQYYLGLSLTTREPTDYADRQRTEYARLMQRVPMLRSLVAVDTNGIEEHRESRVPNHRDRYAPAEAFARMRQQTIPTYLFLPVTIPPGDAPVLTVVLPQPRRGGGVIAEFDLAFLGAAVESRAFIPSGRIYVLDQTGRILAHPDRELVGEEVSLANIPPLSATSWAALTRLDTLTPQWQQIAEGSDVSTRQTEGLSGGSVLTTATWVYPMQWIVVVEQPAATALAPLRAALRRTALLLVVSIVVALGVALVLARRMARPILALQAAATRAAEGDEVQSVSVRTGDELEDLANAFNTMMARVEERTGELVEARTQTLALVDELAAHNHAAFAQQPIAADARTNHLASSGTVTVDLRAIGIEPLTAREHEVLALLARGQTNGEIARALVVSPATVKTHVEHIIAKLGVSDRTQAAVRALELGLLR